MIGHREERSDVAVPHPVCPTFEVAVPLRSRDHSFIRRKVGRRRLVVDWRRRATRMTGVIRSQSSGQMRPT